MTGDRARVLLEIGDVDGLVEHVGSLCLDERWDDIVALRDGCRGALERGHQLWPAAAYAEYRLALDAPPPWACSVLGSAAERFVFGPFTEVVATRFGWSALRPHLVGLDEPTIAALAQERILRGDDLRADDLSVRTSAVFDLPLALSAWEPIASDALYKTERAEFPSPPTVVLTSQNAFAGEMIDDAPATEALAALVGAWRSSPRASVRCAAAEGPVLGAIGALGLGPIGLAEVPVTDALGWCAWAAASGGSAARRRGGAAARSDVWWLVRALADLLDDPVDHTELTQFTDGLRAYVFDSGPPTSGWTLEVAFEDEAEGVAWAIRARDTAEYTSDRSSGDD